MDFEHQMKDLALQHMIAKNKIELEDARATHEAKRKQEALLREQTRIYQKVAEYQLLHQKQTLRPYNMQHTGVGYCTQEKKYYCKLIDLDENEFVDLIAYGQTPEEACDNFDVLWVQGEQRDT